MYRLFLLLFSLCLVSKAAWSEFNGLQYAEIRNLGTGLYLDVQAGRFHDGNKVWLWERNETPAQLFSVNSRQSNWTIKSVNSSVPDRYYFTVKDRSGQVVADVNHTGYERYALTIHKEIEDEDTGFRHMATQPPGVPRPADQEFIIEEKPGSPGTFIIKSLSLGNDKVLTGSGNQKGSPVVFRPYDGLNTQFWVIENQRPEPATNVRLEDFRYFQGGRLLGDVKWNSSQKNVDYFYVTGESNDINWNKSSPTLQNTARGWEIDFKPGLEAKDINWCFKVASVNSRTGTNLSGWSDEVCEIAADGTPPHPGTTSWSKISITNCHSDREAVRIWAMAEGGAWQDKGLIQSQWSGSSCPSTGSAKTIDLVDGKSNQFIGIESSCGSNNPEITDGSCHVLTTPLLKGNSSSPSIYLVQISGG